LEGYRAEREQGEVTTKLEQMTEQQIANHKRRGHLTQMHATACAICNPPTLAPQSTHLINKMRTWLAETDGKPGVTHVLAFPAEDVRTLLACIDDAQKSLNETNAKLDRVLERMGGSA
jgi:hypothetical protein